MAGIRFTATTNEIPTGTAAKTLLQLAAPPNQRVLVERILVGTKGTSNTDPPGLVRVLRQTTTGSMSPLTLRKWDPSDDETLQTTAQQNATAEPSAGDVLVTGECHPQMGWEYVCVPGAEIVVPGGTRLGIEVTFAVSVQATVHVVAVE